MQEASGVYTSPFLDTDRLNMALRAREVSGAFEKRAPGSRYLQLIFLPYRHFGYQLISLT